MIAPLFKIPLVGCYGNMQSHAIWAILEGQGRLLKKLTPKLNLERLELAVLREIRTGVYTGHQKQFHVTTVKT